MGVSEAVTMGTRIYIFCACADTHMHCCLSIKLLSGWIKAWFIHSIIRYIQLSGLPLEQGVRIIEVLLYRVLQNLWMDIDIKCTVLCNNVLLSYRFCTTLYTDSAQPCIHNYNYYVPLLVVGRVEPGETKHEAWWSRGGQCPQGGTKQCGGLQTQDCQWLCGPWESEDHHWV